MTQRWILLGDSIQSVVIEDNNPSGVLPHAKNIASNLISQQTDVLIHNLSSPGNRVSDIGAIGFGVVNHLNSLNLISGIFGAQGLIVTLGTNDWGNSANTTQWANDVRAIVDRAKSLNLKVVLVSPLWRSDHQEYKGGYQMWIYAWMMQTIATEKGVTFINGYDFGDDPLNYGDPVQNPRLHLNTRGHVNFANILVQKMKTLGFWQ